MKKVPQPNQDVLSQYLSDLLIGTAREELAITLAEEPSLKQTLLPPNFLSPRLAETANTEINVTTGSVETEPEGVLANDALAHTSEALTADAALPNARYHDELLTWLDNGRPRWAQSDFDVLLFSVGTLTLAVPLITLGQIQQITSQLRTVFGQAEWLMGLQPGPHGQTRVVNTARYVMPERFDPSQATTPEYIITFEGIQWGLAVDQVKQPIRLKPQDVKWRKQRDKQPWLAGVISEHMCVLIDMPKLGRMLMESEKGSR